MRIDYSKPSADIKKESRTRLYLPDTVLRSQLTAVKTLRKAKSRTHCLLCAKALKGKTFTHRSLPCVVCAACGHIQVDRVPPKDFFSGHEFHKIYPDLAKVDYKDRLMRIYQPKLDWIISCLSGLKYSANGLKSKKWFEIGCGAGYFLAALQQWGVSDMSGLDGDKKLVAQSNAALKEEKVFFYDGKISQCLSRFKADIYTAFFVLEHVEDVHDFFLNLKKMPRGTIFIFSVPVFGLSALLEGVFDTVYARNFDGVIHRQLYTDESIRYAMGMSGFQIAAEWIFGQDAEDFNRFMIHSLREKYSGKRLLDELTEKLNKLQDSLQHCLDQAGWSDQRHIIAVKK